MAEGGAGGGVEKQEEQQEQLGVDPGVAQAVPRRGPLLRHHLQHGQQEVGEVAGVLVRPAVLLHQYVEQRPRLQLGDVPQLACRGQRGAESQQVQRTRNELVQRSVGEWGGEAGGGGEVGVEGHS